jgi:hypothetical protein
MSVILSFPQHRILRRGLKMLVNSAYLYTKEGINHIRFVKDIPVVYVVNTPLTDLGLSSEIV